ncbi:sigma-54-dependent transcriptional regulator [Vogesella oryzae]|uniref:sigma-54-dependent transcriptional regulator n=1 Tax=Vogesella oryzae TaxID=1735285 RepID=UPI0015836428|nr:sigma-54 dependent transcriptional regulator [Vogesella oryzae]
MTPYILLVEDDSSVREACVQTLELADHHVLACDSAEAALSAFAANPGCVVISDVRLPGMDGLQLFAALRRQDGELPVTLVTGHGDVGMAVQAMRDGAWDFIEKPWQRERLLDAVGRALAQRRLQLENRRLRAQLSGEGIDSLLLGDSPALRAFKTRLATVGATDADVLVLGETGSGKELVARALHQVGPHAGGEFVAINCAALPETVFESEMFGAEPGAYTGASKRRIGKIEHADGGTLFLDEIEGMPLALQAKLLRVLETRSVERLGSNRAQPVNCRVVAATKLDLKAESAAGRFRADLYYRLNVVTLRLPPLRERAEDIPLLFSHFARRAAERFGCPLPALSAANLAALMAAPWPGNVRELAHAAERWVLGLEEEPPAAAASLPQQLEQFEARAIAAALQAVEGDVGEAAAQLGIARKTLYDKLSRYGIQPALYRGG